MKGVIFGMIYTETGEVDFRRVVHAIILALYTPHSNKPQFT